MEEVDDILEDRIQDQMETLYTAVNDLRQNQIKSLHDLLETQNKSIVEIQQEQINIKCLLTQLLQKFTWPILFAFVIFNKWFSFCNIFFGGTYRHSRMYLSRTSAFEV